MAHRAISFASFLLPYASTVVDLCTDIVQIDQLWGYWAGYVLMVVLLVTDVIAAIVMVWRLFDYQKRVANNDTESGTGVTTHSIGRGARAGCGRQQDQGSDKQLGSASKEGSALQRYADKFEAVMQKVCLLQGSQGACIRALLFLGLVPLVSATMHAAALLLAVLGVTALVKGRALPSAQSIWGLDPARCVIVRSFAVGFIEAPIAMAFTTWAYVERHKHKVGVFISPPWFFLGLMFSMWHVFLELWKLKDSLVEFNFKLPAVLAQISDVTVLADSRREQRGGVQRIAGGLGIKSQVAGSAKSWAGSKGGKSGSVSSVAGLGLAPLTILERSDDELEAGDVSDDGDSDDQRVAINTATTPTPAEAGTAAGARAGAGAEFEWAQDVDSDDVPLIQE